MKTFERFVHALVTWAAKAAQIVLLFVMLLIVIDVIVRRTPLPPVPGTFELVEMSGAILLALAVAYTAEMKGHIMVGVLVDKFPLRVQAGVDTVVNVVALFFTYLLARETFVFAARMMERKYTTGHLLIPIAPSIYLVGLGFILLALVLFKDLLKAVIVVFKGSEVQ